MENVLRLGYSPCPNDTFIFYGIAQKRIALEPYDFDITLADVEELNQKARQQLLDVTKVSLFALVHLWDAYTVLRSGGAIGRGCGPLVVAREKCSMKALRGKSIAVPGKLTTANLLLQLHGGHEGEVVVMPFERIMPAIARGDVDAGVIIHEGRFTYPKLGLHKVLDLGQWWEGETSLPLPLGCILVKRSLPLETAHFMEAKIRESLLLARARPEEAWPYIVHHAQEMEPDVITQHINTFVNEFSMDVGKEGEEAIRILLEAAFRQEGKPMPTLPLFCSTM